MIIFFIILFFVSIFTFSVLYLKHLHQVWVMSKDELVEVIRLKPSPFKEVDDKFFAPMTERIFYAVPIIFYRSMEKIMKKIKELLVHIERTSDRVIHYVQRREASMDNTRFSPFWKEMHDWRNNLNNENLKPDSEVKKEDVLVE
ncbi:MAG: hypothetical protein COU46_03075 [Candidatus Niyogibacteria bacterium CG10_big_fil_rev_8_21_14_0_10_42_19]|uniref:Uncharacterized protein n=1 Tax=Candidatus Niyogibacteria bacterium CG10_big_fil_rev_8_21_14_0_10_42_19 TaxID=1974725 RepID=A0A2H0TEY9_9BACT|nr:MAG: hypothetical protein COU46_03075 [Candidatus Niyogibacteria bacterium CG10_big_fil_rev_8_21_14_0_10_42_19]